MSYDSGRIQNPSGGGAWTFANLPTGNAAVTIPSGTQAYTTDQGNVTWNGSTWVGGSGTALSSYIRLPMVTDNASLGFSTASLWQFFGSLFQPGAYCSTDSAMW